MVSKIYSKFATDAELLAASGKLQQEINQGGGGSGALIDETYFVHKTGSESISGIKRFLDGIFGFNFNTNSGTLSSSITGYTDEGVPLTGIPELCLDWQGRALYDRGGSPSIDWDFNVLYENGNISVDWEFRELYNSAGDVTANWQSRELHAEDGVCINWGLRQLHAYNGDVVVNWDNKALYGTYVEDFVNIIPVETLAWASRQLLIGEANGFASLNWEGGVLMSTGTNSSGAASNHAVANWFEGILYAIRDSNEPEDGAEAPFVAYPSVDWQNRKLSSFANLGSEEFPDWQSETSLDWSGRLLYNVWGFVGGGLAAYGLLDEETGERPLFGYFFMSDEGMYFEDNNSKTLANINQRRLFGLNEGGFIETSLNWGTRLTFDISGNQSIDWDDRTLISTVYDADEDFDIPLITLDWRNKQILGNWTSDSGIAGATYITGGSNITVEGDGTALSPYIVSSAGGGGDVSGIGPMILNPATREIEYDIDTSSSVISVISPSGIWLKNIGRQPISSTINNRSPVLGFEYASKLGGGTGMPYTGYATVLSANKVNPFEIYTRGGDGVTYTKIWGVGDDTRMPRSTSVPSYFGYTTMTNLGGTRFISGVNSLSFTNAITGRSIVTLATISNSGYYTANYKLDLNVLPSAYQRNIRFYLQGSGERLVANEYENQYYLTIPPNTSGCYTVVGNPSLIVMTGSASSSLNVLVDYDTEGSEQVRMSGYLRLSVQS